MKLSESSSYKVPFDLRPAKQIERRMLVDALQHMAQAGFPIREYVYAGMGSIYFVDFILFHKLLGISQMVTIEAEKELEKRVRFNKPFDLIQVKMKKAGQVIAEIDRTQKYILWLDYDYPVNEEMLSDLYMAGSQLLQGSILLVTADVQSLPDDVPEDTKNIKSYFETEAGKYLGIREDTDFGKTKIASLSSHVIVNAIREGMAGRKGLDFHLLFHFLYADGHEMLTIGGIIASPAEKALITGLNRRKIFYLRNDLAEGPYKISVPRLTRKERHVLDSAMPCDPDWQPDEFLLPKEIVATYREIYRFLPAYAELLL